MLSELTGKVAVVTGAASGIGFGLAEACAAEGMKVVLADIEEGALKDAAGRLDSAGADVLAVSTDVADGAAMDALAAAVEAEYGTWHLVCLNAGVGGGGLAWTLTEADWQWVLGVNLWGVIHGIRVFVPRLVEQEEGHVVNTASMAGLLGGPAMGPYNASKHAVVSLSETLRGDLALAGGKVGVSVLCPGWVNTNIPNADRNRPDALRNAGPAPELTPEQELFRNALAERLATGMEPAAVARLVLDAVTADRFWILTHPEFKTFAEPRFQEILDAFPDP
jgi:NAD(P)-dependent dehydrogenase (short-subunit alcohol dehydrogenase family)